MNKASFRGQVQIAHYDVDGNLKGNYEFPNGIVDVGLNHILETQFNGGTPVTSWHMGLINNAGFTALSNADTMASHSGWAEATVYDQTDRPEWTAGTATGRAITNSTTVDFTMNATATIRGVFIASNLTKGGTTGILWATAAFASNVNVVDNDVLKITYTVSG